MTDVLVRNLGADDVARIDELAERLGLSRNEYLRRLISRDAARSNQWVSVADLAKFADLADDEIMRDAWS